MVKFHFFLVLAVLFSSNKCAQNGKVQRTDSSPDSVAREPSHEALKETVVEVNFEEEIRPILQSRCSPCHFTGGKMYERLPFDEGETILNNSAGILRRIKDETEAKKIRDFVENTSNE